MFDKDYINLLGYKIYSTHIIWCLSFLYKTAYHNHKINDQRIK